MAKTKHPKPAKIASGWSDFRAAIALFREHWQLYSLLILSVSIPSDLIGMSSTFSADATLGTVVQVAALFMNLAVLWAVIQHIEGKKVTFGQAFYDGTAAMLRFILIGLTLVGLLIFAAIGVFIYEISVQSIYAPPPTSPEQLLIGFVCALLALPSIFLITRFGLAYIGVVHDNLRPIAALRRSWRLTRGRFWRVLGHGAQLLVYMAIVAIPPSLLAAALGLLKAGGWATFVFELCISVLALPIGNTYLVRFYRHLKQTAPDQFMNPTPQTDLFDD